MITCCKDCVPPKRHGGCHSTCREYIEQKALHDAQLEEANRRKILAHNLFDQKGRAIRTAEKIRKKGKSVWRRKSG